VTRADPKHKGVGVVAVVKGLKANPQARACVPPHLAPYLEMPILATSWYPEKDYNALIMLLAASIDPKQVGGDVWAYFGRTAAQRDIGGDQSAVREASRIEKAGIYRNFRDIAAHDVAGLFLRMTKMWTLYHDSGRLFSTRHSDLPNVVVVQLHDFAFASQGMADLQTAYMVEYAKLSGFSIKGERVAYSPSGCEWHYELASHPELERSMARLPAGRPAHTAR
jgi:hypothetical protein